MAQRLATALCFLCVAITSACASQGNPYEEEGAREVELVVSNERQSVVTAYYQWRQGRPSRLGEIEGASSMTFTVPVRGQELRVFFVSSGQSPGDPARPEYAPARGGDRFAWTLRPDGSIFYLRLSQ